MSLARFHAVVSGDVQGVGYRAYVQYHASRLGVTGYARNDWDGSVQVIAEGERGALEALTEKLRKGPRSAVVSRVDLVWSEPVDEFRGFAIRY